MKGFVLTIVMLITLTTSAWALTTGDYRTSAGAAGNWTTLANWERYNGSSWVTPAPTYPGEAAYNASSEAGTVTILSGTSITLSSDITTNGIGNLVIEGTASLKVSAATLYYIGINGNITCDGTIGNGATLDGISFDILSSCTISGTGAFDCAVIRKNGATATALAINRNVNLRGSGTNFYNNGTHSFSTTINNGATLTSYGDISMDGTNGTGAADVNGQLTINTGGTVTVTGTIYATTNNTSITCSILIPGGILNANLISRPASGAGGFGINVSSSGTINFTEVNGGWANYSTTNNTVILSTGTTVNFNAAGSQTVAGPDYDNANVNISDSGTKTATNLKTSGTVSIEGTCTVTGGSMSVRTLNTASGTTLNAASLSNNNTVTINGAATFSLDVNASTFSLTSTGTFSCRDLYSTNVTVSRASVLTVSSLIINNVGKLTLDGTATVSSRPLYGAGGTLQYDGTTARTTGVEFTGLSLDDKLIINNTAGVTMAANKAILDVTCTAGNLTTTAAYTLRFSGVLTETSGNRVIGNLRTTRDASTTNTFGGIGITLVGDAGNTSVTVIRTTGTAGITTVGSSNSISRKYVVSGAATLVDVTISWLDSDDNSKTLTDMAFWLGTSPWTQVGAVSDVTGTRTLTRTVADLSAAGVSSLNGTFTASDGTSPLPVEFTSFSASVTGSNVLLNWATATEVDNRGFEIERSAVTEDARIWETIGFVEGSGNSNSPKEYSFADDSPFGGTTFAYRLKQIDNDGDFEYSDVVEAVITPTEYALDQNYPNPFNPSTTIRFSLLEKGMVKLTVYSILGEKVMDVVNKELEAGVYQFTFDAGSLNSGVYVYSLQTANFSAVKKMMLVK